MLVHSAGIAGPAVPLVDYPLDAWRSVLDIDLTGAFQVNQAVVRRMMGTGYGRIVNIASNAGKEGNPNASAYSAAKAGLIALTKSLGKETADQDIMVNVITPAAAKTRILEQVSQAHIDYMLSKILGAASSRSRRSLRSSASWRRRKFVHNRCRLRHLRRARNLLVSRFYKQEPTHGPQRLAWRE